MRRSSFWILALVAVPLAVHAEDDPFGYFLGSWKCSGHFVKSGEAISSTITVARDEQTSALIVRHDDDPPHAFHAMEVWAAARTPGQLRAVIADKFSGERWYSSEGWKGDSLVWSRSEDGHEVERFAYARQSERSMKVDWLVAKNGEFVLGDTLDCAKL